VNTSDEALEQIVLAEVKTIAFRQVQRDEPLLTSNVVDSIGLVDLLVALENKFSIRIDANSVNPQNFNTVADMVQLIKGKIL
jgi:acyl carrier protein